MPRPTHFEILCDDTDRAIKFYHDVFGWDIQKWDGPMEYWMVMTGDPDTPGIDGGLAKRSVPDQHGHNTIEVSSIDTYSEKVVSLGGTVIGDKHPVPGVGWLVTCRDSEGNVFSMIQLDRNTKS